MLGREDSACLKYMFIKEIRRLKVLNLGFLPPKYLYELLVFYLGEQYLCSRQLTFASSMLSILLDTPATYLLDVMTSGVIQPLKVAFQFVFPRHFPRNHTWRLLTFRHLIALPLFHCPVGDRADLADT